MGSKDVELTHTPFHPYNSEASLTEKSLKNRHIAYRRKLCYFQAS